MTSRKAPRGFALAACVVAAVVVTPLLYLLVRAFEGGVGRYLATIGGKGTLTLTLETLALVGGVLLLTVSVALPLAWIIARTDLPGRRILAILAAVPLVFPSYVAAFSWVAFVGPHGFLQQLLAPLGVERLPEIAYGFSGAWFTLSLFTYPYLYLPLVGAIRDLDSSLEESARTLGSSRFSTFFRVVLPQLLPALAGGGLLVTLYTISDFGAVSIVRYNTLTLGVYRAYTGQFDRGAAAALSTLLVLLTAVCVGARWLVARNVRATRRRASRPPAPVPLGRWRVPSLLAVVGLVLVGVGMPLATCLFWAVRARVVGNPLGFDPLAALHSLEVAALAALFAVVAAVPVATWSERFPTRPARIVGNLCYAGHALPGLVVALAVISIAIRTPIYQTLGLLVLAYCVRFLPEALAPLESALRSVAPTFEQAARSLGATRTAAVRRVTLPMVRNGLLAGAGLVFLTTMKELPATLLLRPIGFETLATRIWSAAGEGIYSEAAVPSLLLLSLSVLPVYYLVIRPTLAERS